MCQFIRKRTTGKHQYGWGLIKSKKYNSKKKNGKIGGLRVKRVFISGRVRGQEVRGGWWALISPVADVSPSPGSLFIPNNHTVYAQIIPGRSVLWL